MAVERNEGISGKPRFDILQGRGELDQFSLGAADREYIGGLLARFRAGKTPVFLIGEGGNFIPSALMSPDARSRDLGIVDYGRQIKGNPRYIHAAKEATLVVHPLDGGIGSSVGRGDYVGALARKTGRVDPETDDIDARLGAKGTDLHFGLMVERPGVSGLPYYLHTQLSTTEIKNLRLLADARKYGSVQYKGMQNDESKRSIETLLDKPFPFTSSGIQTWREELTQGTNITILPPFMQQDLPTIDVETGRLTDERTAPGSHGQVGIMVLHDIAGSLPIQDGKHQVRVIYNGDGVNNFVSPEMVGFAAEEQAAVVMLFTTRTKNDIKGGILGVSNTADGGKTMQIIELVQAKNAGQEDIFLSLGMRDDSGLPDNLRALHSPGEQSFNTNIVLLNEGVLSPFLRLLKAEIGDEAFAEAIAPNLIENKKKQNGKEFIQLEGALSSCMFNLNRFVTTDPTAKELWEIYGGGRPFTRIINLDTTERDNFFTPVKFAVDFWLLAHTDHYKLNRKTWELENVRPGHIPAISETIAQEPYYMDVSRVLEAFGKNSHVLELDELDIDGVYQINPKDATKKKKSGGKVRLPNSILKGIVHITSAYDGVFDLTSENARAQLGQTGPQPLVLENKEISIDPEGMITVRSVLQNNPK